MLQDYCAYPGLKESKAKVVARPWPIESEERQPHCCTGMGQGVVSQGTCLAVVFRATLPAQEGCLPAEMKETEDVS